MVKKLTGKTPARGPRSKKPKPEPDPTLSPGERLYQVTITRVVEQFARFHIRAPNEGTAEATAERRLEDREPEFMASLRWSNGEVESGESVADVEVVE